MYMQSNSYAFQVSTGDLKELFPVGSRQLEPTVTRLDYDKLMLGRDEMSILIDSDGNPTQKYPLTWSDIPIALGRYSQSHLHVC